MSASSGGFPASFSVDGQRYGGRSLAWRWRSAVGVMLTADADAVGGLLPSPLLHPLRVSRNRTVLSVGGAEVEWRVGSLPPFRSLELQVIAMVTAGKGHAPPLLPLAGLMLDRGRDSYGAGFVPLLVTTSNRVAAELYRQLLGWPAVVTDVTQERLPGHLRYVSSDAGTLLADVVSRSGMPMARFREAQPLYGIRERQLFRATLSGRGVGGDVAGRAVAFLSLGEHPAVQPLRGIELRDRGWSSSYCAEFTQHLIGPVRVLGSTPLPAEPVPTGTLMGAAVRHEHPGQRVALDQGLDRLPFDPAGEFRTAASTGTAGTGIT